MVFLIIHIFLHEKHNIGLQLLSEPIFMSSFVGPDFDNINVGCCYYKLAFLFLINLCQ